jgi:hypothetical protein
MTDAALMVGPQDPESTAELVAKGGVGDNAVKLLERQARNQPVELMGILAMPPDQLRSDSLDTEEVDRHARRAIQGWLDEAKADGDSVSPDYSADDVLIDGRWVRGTSDRTRVVTITYVLPSGRSAKAAIGSYSDFPASQASYELQHRRAMGIREDVAQLQGAPVESPEAEALRAELARVEAELAEARDPAPFEGYAEMTAKHIVDNLIADATIGDVEALLEYERRHEDRSTVVTAAGKRIVALKQAEADVRARELEELEQLRAQVAELRAKG